MNIEQAKTIPITLILDKMNFTPQRRNDNQLTYFSPLLKKKRPSFSVNTTKNVWRDHALSIGGDIIDFAVRYLEREGLDHAVSDALRYLKRMSGYVPLIQPVEDHGFILEDKTLALKEVRKIKEKALIHYGKRRGIPEAITTKYMKEARVHSKKSGKDLYALCMKNEDNGYELLNQRFNGYVGKRAITFIRGTQNNYEGIHVFKEAMDFLSVMTQREGQPFKDDSIILHSLNCLGQGAAYIIPFGYRTGYTWMTNDDLGRKALKSWTDFFANENNLVHMPMNDLYEGHRDINAAHMHKLGLKMVSA